MYGRMGASGIKIRMVVQNTFVPGSILVITYRTGPRAMGKKKNSDRLAVITYQKSPGAKNSIGTAIAHAAKIAIKQLRLALA